MQHYIQSYNLRGHPYIIVLTPSIVCGYKMVHYITLGIATTKIVQCISRYNPESFKVQLTTPKEKLHHIFRVRSLFSSVI